MFAFLIEHCDSRCFARLCFAILSLYAGVVSGEDVPRITIATHRYGGVQLMTIGIDGSNPQQLTNEPDGATQATWSPDGTKVAYVVGAVYRARLKSWTPTEKTLTYCLKDGRINEPRNGRRIVNDSYFPCWLRQFQLRFVLDQCRWKRSEDVGRLAEIRGRSGLVARRVENCLRDSRQRRISAVVRNGVRWHGPERVARSYIERGGVPFLDERRQANYVRRT